MRNEEVYAEKYFNYIGNRHLLRCDGNCNNYTHGRTVRATSSSLNRLRMSALNLPFLKRFTWSKTRIIT